MHNARSPRIIPALMLSVICVIRERVLVINSVLCPTPMSEFVQIFYAGNSCGFRDACLNQSRQRSQVAVPYPTEAPTLRKAHGRQKSQRCSSMQSQKSTCSLRFHLPTNSYFKSARHGLNELITERPWKHCPGFSITQCHGSRREVNG